MPRQQEPQLRRPDPPSAKTLANYGLTAEDWRLMCVRQDWTCPVCRQPFGDRKLAIDHDHVHGWHWRSGRKKDGTRRSRFGTKGSKGSKDGELTPAQRKVHVRGVLHMWCNGLIRKWLTEDRAKSIYDYLVAHRTRRDAARERR